VTNPGSYKAAKVPARPDRLADAVPAVLAPLFDERNEAVRRMIHIAIEAAKRNSKKIGICGQAPSDYPEFARFLVEQGIDSISLNPDSVLKTLIDIAATERKLKSRGKVA
jgi:pyruvate,water dikinase